jgi:hypothetical protein
MHRLVTALTSHSIWTGEADGGQDDTYGFALAAHPGKSQGRPSTNTGSKPIERDRPARPRLPQGAPVPDGRTVLTTPDTIGAPERSLGAKRRLRHFILDTNPLERFNREVGRRTDVVGIFPDDRSLIRLAGMLCIEQNDEWLVGRGYLSAESISLVLTGPAEHTPTEIKEETPALQAG